MDWHSSIYQYKLKISLYNVYMLLKILIFFSLALIFQDKLLLAENELIDSDGKKKYACNQLNNKIIKLCTQVENIYKRKLSIYEVKSNKFLGHSNPDKFLIEINKNVKYKDVLIAHELFHLKLKKEGYAKKYQFIPSEKLVKREEIRLTKHVYPLLRQPILHFIFYPKMKKLGLIPNVNIEEQIRKEISEDRFINKNYYFEINVLYYMKYLLEVNNELLLSKINTIYEEQKLTNEIHLGQELANIIIESKPRTPLEEVATFVKCINQLYKKKYKFSLQEIISTENGETVARIKFKKKA